MDITGINGAALGAGIDPTGRLGGGTSGMRLDEMMRHRPDPDRPLAERGIDVGELEGVAELLGTDATTLGQELGEDASMRDLMTHARDAGARPLEVVQALVSDLGGAPSGSPFGAQPGGLPPFLFDSAADPTSSLLDLLTAEGEGEGESER